jgi:hypothetical protein
LKREYADGYILEVENHLKFTQKKTLFDVCFVLRSQPVDATQAFKLSAGVSKPKVLRGRSFNRLATAFSLAWECTDKSVPLGKYCLSKPFVFSLEPRCHGLRGSQK